jgi:hypothetical protein
MKRFASLMIPSCFSMVETFLSELPFLITTDFVMSGPEGGLNKNQ